MASDQPEYDLIVDSSAIVAMARREPTCEAIGRIVTMTYSSAAISAPNVLEASMVISRDDRRNPVEHVQKILADAGIAVEPFGLDSYAEAFQTFLAFGKGRHAAALNFGDCMSAGLAKIHSADLLYVGDDFARAGFRRLV